MKKNYTYLFKNINYEFKNLGLIERALCHRSVGKDSNERLEFLGDSILNCVIAGELFHRYPDLKEGAMSRLRANLVNEDSLADLANQLKIGEFIKFSSGELRSGGAKRKSILADTIEAIIGAIYLDAGFDNVKECILKWFAEKIIATEQHTEQKDPKTLLQELLQMRKLPLPVYTVEAIAGVSHAQLFTVKCVVTVINTPTLGNGVNKRSAERNAAEKMLELINLNNG